MHQHRAKERTEPRASMGRAVYPPVKRNASADGGVYWRETCSCGASRVVAVNGRAREVSTWEVAS